MGGFTLVELMIVLTLIGILSSLAVMGLMYGTGRARLNNAAFQTGALYSIAKMKAKSTGRFEYVVYWEAGTKFGVDVIESADAIPAASWSTADPANLASSLGATQVDHLDISAAGGVSFATLSTLPTSSEPVPPFSPVDFSSYSGSGLAGACSFCVAASGGTLGAVEFGPDGLANLVTGGTTATGVVALRIEHQGETQALSRVIAVSAPGGVVKVF